MTGRYRARRAVVDGEVSTKGRARHSFKRVARPPPSRSGRRRASYHYQVRARRPSCVGGARRARGPWSRIPDGARHHHHARPTTPVMGSEQGIIGTLVFGTDLESDAMITDLLPSLITLSPGLITVRCWCFKEKKSQATSSQRLARWQDGAEKEGGNGTVVSRRWCSSAV